MLVIHYPEPEFRTKTSLGKRFIFDGLRRKWLLLTPEEWVRQNFIQYLIRVQGYPAAQIAQEKSIRVGEMSKRFDILVYDRQHEPWLMVECKAPEIKLEESVLHQLLRYHSAIPAGMLVITNGSSSYAWKKNGQQLELIEELPVWEK